MSTLPDKLTCGNGHTFTLPDEAGSNEEVSCPDCGEVVSLESQSAPRSGSKGRSLWAVMQSGGEADTAEPESEAAASLKTPSPAPQQKWNVVESSEGDSPEDESDAGKAESVDEIFAEAAAPAGPSPEDRPRGLWAMMGQTSVDDPPAADSPVDETATDDESVAQESRVDGDNDEGDNDEGASLEELLEGDEDFEVRGSSDGGVTTPDGKSRGETDSPEDSDNDLLSEDQDEEDGWEVEEYDDDDVESVAAAPRVGKSIEVPLPDGPVVNPGAKTAVLALGFGVAAFLFAGLNLLPDFWVKIPSTLAGLAALVWGYQSLNESKRSQDWVKLKLMAGGGLACGLVGMFAGPLALNAIGDGWREDQLRGAITKNLNGIGEGVEVFYEHHGAFPRATYVVDGNVDVPMHSWMSALLPHMSYDELALGIDRKKPYDDPANFGAMSTIVPTFLVPNVDHQPTLRGLATAHFAGVGGETLTDAGRVDVGVFSRGMTITRDVLSDGASQTMLAGEITRALPAWGEPGNWRTIGRGLNRQVSGFGNSAGTGAHFLMADGSVKFFPNSTSRDVLLRLSTRNGGDSVSVPD
jgi:hypothetical protein